MRRSKAQALSPVVLVVQPGRLLIKGHPLVPRPLSILPRQRPAAPRHPALGHRPTRRASHRHPIIPGPRIMGPGRAHSARHLAALRSSSVDPAPRGRRSYLREPGILTFLRMVNRLAGPNMVCHLEARLDPATRWQDLSGLDIQRWWDPVDPSTGWTKGESCLDFFLSLVDALLINRGVNNKINNDIIKMISLIDKQRDLSLNLAN